jgi:hypothetical protein
MMRWIAVGGCALALALAMPTGNEAVADGITKRPAPVFTKKRCIAPAMWLWRTGTGQTTWVCAASEICCYDRLLRKGTCLAAGQRCF